MKIQFFHALLVSNRGRDLRRSHSVLVRAVPYSAAASNDALFQRPRLLCRWWRNPDTGCREMRWSTRD